MEEGQKHRNMTILPYTVRCRSRKRCCTAVHSRKDTGITVDCIYLPCRRNDRAARAGAGQPRRLLCCWAARRITIFSCEAGLLEAYQSPELTDVPEAYQDEQGVWNPIYIGTLCFACNTDWFARTGTPMPTCWDDLLSPALGQIVMATDPKSSGYLVYYAGNACSRCAARTRRGASQKVRSECRSILYCIEYRTG